MHNETSHHVIQNPKGGWDIKRSCADRSSGHFVNKQDAIIEPDRFARIKGLSLPFMAKTGEF